MFSDDFRGNWNKLIWLNWLNIRNEIWQWSLTRRIWDIYISEFIYMLLCYHCFTRSVPVIFLKCKLTSANNPWKWYDTGLSGLKESLSSLRCLSDYQIIPLQIPIALYQTRRNGVIREEQYQTNNLTKSYIIPLQVLNSSKSRQYRPSYQNNIWWLYY